MLSNPLTRSGKARQINLDYHGAALALSRRGDFWPSERQAEFEQLIEEVIRVDKNLPPKLHMLWLAMPNHCHFLAYACDVFDHHDRITETFHNRDWRGYVEAHPQYLRPRALDLAVRCGLCGELYWQLLTFVFIYDDCNDKDNRRIFRTLYSGEDYSEKIYGFENSILPYRRALMNATELQIYKALPEMVTIYRGAPDPHYSQCPEGMSWTLEYRIAEFYAGRREGVIYVVQFPKEAIWTYYEARGEAEVLIDSNKLEDCSYDVVYPLTGPSKHWPRSMRHWPESPLLDANAENSGKH